MGGESEQKLIGDPKSDQNRSIQQRCSLRQNAAEFQFLSRLSSLAQFTLCTIALLSHISTREYFSDSILQCVILLDEFRGNLLSRTTLIALSLASHARIMAKTLRFRFLYAHHFRRSERNSESSMMLYRLTCVIYNKYLG